MAAISGECFTACQPPYGEPNSDCRQPHCACLCHETNGRRR